MVVRGVLLCLVFGVVFVLGCQKGVRRLTEDDAELLVMNVPEVTAAERAGRFPKAEKIDLGDSNYVAFQVRSTRTSAASGMIGNFWVNLETGQVFSDIDKTQKVDSERLRSLRKKLLGSNNQGNLKEK